ncbi:MAG: PIN domain-containing protein [Candidatus Pacebacteria bacterium]|nr:PIN domain-containing protein [Candidatus Paceibacterota bacterium]
MPEKAKAIDTNLIIRFLVEDDVKKADAVEKLLKKAEKEKIEIPDVIFAEIAWVLLSFYALNKKDVVEKLEGLLGLKFIKMNRDILEKTVEIFNNFNVSYIDAYLVAYALENNQGVIYSFDKGFDKIKQITRIEP